MWARVDDHFDEHKKVFIAGERLGGANPTGRVLAVWLEGRLWSNRNNTLGFVPMNIVKRFQHDDDPLAVAAVLSAPLTDDERARWNTDSVNCLWIQEGAGFRYHDDEHYRPKKSAEEVTAIRAEIGRRGGIASAAKRKQTRQQIASPEANQTNGPPKQIGSFGSPEIHQKGPPTESDAEAKLKQTGNPVSRFPVPGTDLPEPRGVTHTARASASPLVTAPVRLRNIRFFSQVGLNVPNFLHDTEFRPRLVGGGVTDREADKTLDAWYVETEAKFATQQIGDEPIVFWRKRFAEWRGTTSKAPSATEAVKDPAAALAKQRYGKTEFGK